MLEDCAVFSTIYSRIWPVYRVLGGGTFQHFTDFGIIGGIQLYALQLVYSLLK